MYSGPNHEILSSKINNNICPQKCESCPLGSLSWCACGGFLLSNIMRISDINIKARIRKDMGDLQELADSIEKLGLLHPVVVGIDGDLICGERRVEAYKLLALTDIAVTIVDMENNQDGEIAENTDRKDFAITEKVEIWQAMESYQGRNQYSDELPSESDGSSEPRKRAAIRLGISTDTLSKARQVIQYDNQDIIDEMDITGNVNDAYKKVKKIERELDIAKQREAIEQGEIESPSGLFDIIVIDPPWNYDRKYDPETSRVANPYPEMSIEEISKIDIPCADNCILWLWTTHKFLPTAFDLLKKWGFDYKATMVWDKKKMGMGYWLRMQTEFCLLGIKGSPLWGAKDIRDIIHESRREHSRKPESFYQMIEEHFPGRKLDYFSRQQRDGWDSYGNNPEMFK